MADEIGDRFEVLKHRIKREADNAEKQIAEAQAVKVKLRGQIMRIEAGLPESDACPDCWVNSGETNIIVAMRAAEPNRFDRWGCRKCGFFFDVTA